MINTHPIFEKIDRHANAILVAASSVMMLLFTSFVFVLAQATLSHAQETESHTCKGNDLIASYQKNEPEKYAKLRLEADQTLNGNAIFWKVEKDGVPTSYLLGTMHMADSRIAKLSEQKQSALENAETVIVENIESLDPAQASAAMLEFKDMTLYTDGTTLADRMSPEELEKLKLAAEARGMPFAVAQIMQPWLIAISVALPVCELKAKNANDPVLDSVIALHAKGSGQTLVGLETIGEQFSAMYDLPETFHLAALKETLNMGDLVDDVMETMKLLYLKGDIGMIQPFTKAVSPNTSSTKEFADFNINLITNRNKVMAERSLPYLEKGNVFLAVGALHLPGETGLVNALKTAGYEVSPVAE